MGGRITRSEDDLINSILDALDTGEQGKRTRPELCKKILAALYEEFPDHEWIASTYAEVLLEEKDYDSVAELVRAAAINRHFYSAEGLYLLLWQKHNPGKHAFEHSEQLKIPRTLGRIIDACVALLKKIKSGAPPDVDTNIPPGSNTSPALAF